MIVRIGQETPDNWCWEYMGSPSHRAQREAIKEEDCTRKACLCRRPDFGSLEVKPTFQFSVASVPMATSAPLLGKAAHSKASIFYGADEYLEELTKKYQHDHEIAALKNALPGEGDPNAAGVAQSSDKMLSVQKNDENRSLKTNRLFPTPNKPDPMPQNLAFLFTKITPDRSGVLDNSFDLLASDVSVSAWHTSAWCRS